MNASTENLHHRPRKGRKVKPQAFYPCPPPTAGEMQSSSSSDSDAEDPIGYIDTLVRTIQNLNLSLIQYTFA